MHVLILKNILDNISFLLYNKNNKDNNNKDDKDNVDSGYLLFFEYANNGILRDYLKDNFSKLDWNIKLRFTIHTSKNIIRRNLFI
ncbi:unnamed protein product [Rhizophagus irregularis]|nr:unnamed protein product [Rhizophagus irregularis]CAB5386166.1 unnamed protein product [Rhizophagus irregularis]